MARFYGGQLHSGPEYGQCVSCGKLYDITTREKLPEEEQPRVPGVRGSYHSSGVANISHSYCDDCVKSGRTMRALKGEEKSAPDAVPLARAEMGPRQHFWWRSLKFHTKKEEGKSDE